MRRLIAALLLSAAPALADDTTTSGLIAEQGLSGAITALEAEAASPDRDLALSAVRFLGGIEAAYQARWQIGATAAILPLPILDAELSENPDPRPIEPGFLNDLAADLAQAMQTTRETLPEGDAALVLRLTDLWLDVDGDGRRGPDEGLLQLAGLPAPDTLPEIRFDSADAHWLRAYTHMLEGFAGVLRAFDSAPALERRIALHDALAAQFAEPPGQMARAPNMDMHARQWGPTIDNVAALIQTLRNQPDPALIAESADHLRSMVAANRDFWTAVAAETDNDREWIPNDRQQAALGFDLPPGSGEAWLAVLADFEAVLDGTQLIPFWRYAPGHGIDLKMWIEDPAPIDLIDWIQGTGPLPYVRPGLTVSEDATMRFMQMFSGRAGLYMILFN